VDETYIKVKGEDRYLYRAVETEGKYPDFFTTAVTDTQGKQLFRKTLQVTYQEPRVINVDKMRLYHLKR